MKTVGLQKTKQDWPKGYKLNAFYVPRGVGGQVVVVMLWPATNHTEFKLYAFSFNTHHAPETAAACRIEAAVAPPAAAVRRATTTAAATLPAVTLLRIAMVLQQRLVLKGVNDSNRVRPYIP